MRNVCHKIGLFVTLLVCFGGQIWGQSENDMADFGIIRQASFPGGMDSLYMYICRNLSYPPDAFEQGLEGKVYVTFVVEKDGRVSNVRVTHDIGGGCGAAAKEVVEKMPKWKPAKSLRGAVRAQFSLPINFQLSDSDATGNLGKEEQCRYDLAKLKE